MLVVMVNRIWYWTMGRGLVRSLDNFGSTGEEPTHPELLDYLASQFVAEGWSVKQLIKAIALEQSINNPPRRISSTGLDPDNHFYHRANRKRLRAEDLVTRLQMGGNLDLSRGGPSIKAGTKIEYGYQFEHTSQRLPTHLSQHLPEVFEVFDFADPNIQTGETQRCQLLLYPRALAGELTYISCSKQRKPSQTLSLQKRRGMKIREKWN